MHRQGFSIQEGTIARRWHLVYSIIVLQGLASAVPWNVFVTESEYFGLRVHVPPFSRVLADNFENVNLVISQAACVALT